MNASDPQAALAVQVGGQHYKKGIQPFQLSMANGHDGCIHAIQKYLTRFSREAEAKGYQGLQKAHHICMIRVETMAVYGVPHPDRALIGIHDYCASNELTPTNSAVVKAVESWSQKVDCDHHEEALKIRAFIRALAQQVYPSVYKEEDFTA